MIVLNVQMAPPKGVSRTAPSSQVLTSRRPSTATVRTMADPAAKKVGGQISLSVGGSQLPATYAASARPV